jgi:2',5'-phosphodiesterase
MFWNLQIFHREALQEQFPIRDLVEIISEEDTDWGSMRDINKLLDRKPDLKRVVQEKVGQVFQVATLRLKDPKGKAENLVVGNTHLFYHPMADHIRAIQIYMICLQVDRIRRAGKNALSPSPFIICGDLNSDPLSGAIRLLLHRKLEPYHFETWKHLDAYSWEQGEEEFLLEHGFIGNDVGDEPIYQNEAFRDASQDLVSANPESMHLTVEPPWISLPSSFPHLESGYEKIPEFTNFAVDFAETLDYIFASKTSSADKVGFELISSASIPYKEEMKEFVAMPNKNMPSDHVSIACDLKWVDNS